MHVANLLRIVCLIIGLLLWASAAFLYEDEERRLKNKLVDWWVRSSEFGDRATSLHAAVARSTLRAIDFVFGERAFSGRLLWSSAMVSAAAVIVSLGAAALWLHSALVLGNPLVEQGLADQGLIANHAKLVAIGCVAMALALVVLALAPTLLEQPGGRWRWAVVLVSALLSVRPLAMFASLLVATAWAAREPGTMRATAVTLWLALLVALGCDFVFVATLRAILRRASNLPGVRGLLLMVLVVLIPVFIVGLPDVALKLNAMFGRPAAHPGSRVLTVVAVIFAAPTNVIDLLVSLGLLITTAIVAANLLFWPFLSRVLYALHARFPGRRTVIALGTLFVAAYLATPQAVLERLFATP